MQDVSGTSPSCATLGLTERIVCMGGGLLGAGAGRSSAAAAGDETISRHVGEKPCRAEVVSLGWVWCGAVKQSRKTARGQVRLPLPTVAPCMDAGEMQVNFTSTSQPSFQSARSTDSAHPTEWNPVGWAESNRARPNRLSSCSIQPAAGPWPEDAPSPGWVHGHSWSNGVRLLCPADFPLGPFLICTLGHVPYGCQVPYAPLPAQSTPAGRCVSIHSHYPLAKLGVAFATIGRDLHVGMESGLSICRLPPTCVRSVAGVSSPYRDGPCSTLHAGPVFSIRNVHRYILLLSYSKDREQTKSLSLHLYPARLDCPA